MLLHGKLGDAKGLISVVGGSVFHLSFANAVSLGNFIPYLASYWSKYHHLDLDISFVFWMLTFYDLGAAVFQPTGSFLQQKLGLRLTCLLCLLIQSGFTALSYFTLDMSIVLFVITFSILPSFGASIAHSLIMSNNDKVRCYLY